MSKARDRAIAEFIMNVALRIVQVVLAWICGMLGMNLMLVMAALAAYGRFVLVPL